MPSQIIHIPAPAKQGPIVWTDRELLFALKTLALGDSTIGRRTFVQRRVGPSPSTGLYERRFGSWNHALELAGLDVVQQPDQLQGTTTKWTESQLVDAVRKCLAATGSTAVATYENWRKAQNSSNGLPPASTIRFRLGSWSRATQLATSPASSSVPHL